MRTRLSLWSWALLMLVMGGLGSAQAAERMAMGLIVKLKDSQPQSVVRLRALAVPKDALSSQRLRLSAASQRARVSFLRHKPTAFGAMVMDNAKLTTVAQAEVEAARLRADPDVEWVIVNELARPMALVSNDRYLSSQSWMSDDTAGGTPNVPAAFRRLSQAGLPLRLQKNEVVVAVLDTGILPHPDLDGRIYGQGSAPSGGYDFVSNSVFSNDGDGLDVDATDPGDYLDQSAIDQFSAASLVQCNQGRDRNNNPIPPDAHVSQWHGTATAGILAAAGNNSLGIVGMLAPLSHVPVLPVRVAGSCGASVSDIIEGMFWAAGINYYGAPTVPNAHPARVLSLSFGGGEGCACANKGNLGGADGAACLYQNAVDALTRRGALLVASAGNEDVIAPRTKASWPASCPGVLAVNALQADGAKASYANLTPVDSTHFAVATLGGDTGDNGIFTTYNRGVRSPVDYDGSDSFFSDYAALEGTSMSAPIAAGAVALMWAVNPDLSPGEILIGLRDHGVRAHVPSSSLSDLAQTCSPLLTTRCACTTATCGSGVLDVDQAVAWAMTATAQSQYVDAPVTASFFVPERLQPQTSGKSGGGGSFDGALLALLAAATGLAMRSRGRQHLHA